MEESELTELFDQMRPDYLEACVDELQDMDAAEIWRELSTAAQLLEGFCIATESQGFIPLWVMHDARARAREALRRAHEAASG